MASCRLWPKWQVSRVTDLKSRAMILERVDLFAYKYHYEPILSWDLVFFSVTNIFKDPSLHLVTSSQSYNHEDLRLPPIFGRNRRHGSAMGCYCHLGHGVFYFDTNCCSWNRRMLYSVQRCKWHHQRRWCSGLDKPGLCRHLQHPLVKWLKLWEWTFTQSLYRVSTQWVYLYPRWGMDQC